MARTKKIGLKSKHITAPPPASPPSSTASSNFRSRLAMPVVIQLTSNTNKLRNIGQKTESVSHLNKNTDRMDTVINAQLALDKPSKFNARYIVEIILTLSVAIASTSKSGEMTSKGQKIGFLHLPFELRTQIYNYVLAVEEDTYKIECAPYTSCSEWQARQNAYKVTNINTNHFALAAVNKQISAEVKAHACNDKHFKFASTYALDAFLLTEEDGDLRIITANVDILSKASKGEVVVGKRPFSRTVREHCVELFETLTELLPTPVEVEYVDTEGDSQTIILGL